MGLNFLPTCKKLGKERENCLADDIECHETKSVASIRATMKNWIVIGVLGDPNVKEKVEITLQNISWMLLLMK